MDFQEVFTQLHTTTIQPFCSSAFEEINGGCAKLPCADLAGI